LKRGKDRKTLNQSGDKKLCVIGMRNKESPKNSSRRFVVMCSVEITVVSAVLFLQSVFEQMTQSVCGNCESPFSKVSKPKSNENADWTSRKTTCITTMKKRYFVLLLNQIFNYVSDVSHEGNGADWLITGAA